MSNIARMMQRATAGAGGAGLDVDEVFSTTLYEGTNAAHTITNNIDLTEGGMLWFKNRDLAEDPMIVDTVRGGTKDLYPNEANAEDTDGSIASFNNNGFTFISGANKRQNVSGYSYVNWTFRKAPKFFDVVKYTGTGSTQNISHNLGVVPAMIMVKGFDSQSDAARWNVFHKDASPNGTPQNGRMALNTVDAYNEHPTVSVFQGLWNNTAPTDSVFTVGSYGDTNGSGQEFIAYLFAHNNNDGEFGPDSDQDIIKCGSYTGNGSSTGTVVNLGFEPQFLMIKRAVGGTGPWAVADSMRGVTADGKISLLRWNTNGSEATGVSRVGFTSTGFQLKNSDSDFNNNGDTYIYMAIRKGPLAAPTDATKVFAIDTRGSTGDGAEPAWRSTFPVDFALAKNVTGATNWTAKTRLLGAVDLNPNTTSAEQGASNNAFDYMNGHFSNAATTYSNQYSWMWKRAPSYFDVATYVGNSQSSAITVNHNLGVVPEMMWVKKRGATSDWMVYHKDLNGGTNPHTYRLRLNSTGGEGTGSGVWNAAPTATQFSVGTDSDVNSGSFSHIAYLFATVASVSKVGSFTGNGSNQNIECGFSSGARFVLIKRTDSSTSGEWYVFDTVRGIVSGNDSTLYLNYTDAADTSLDIIDPYSGGFNVNNNSARININTASYIFYAIA